MRQFLLRYATGIIWGGSLLAIAYACWAIVRRLFPAVGDGQGIGADFGVSVYEIPFLACGLLGLLHFAPRPPAKSPGLPIAFLLLAAVSVFSAWVVASGGDSLEKGIPIILISTPLCLGILLYLVWKGFWRKP